MSKYQDDIAEQELLEQLKNVKSEEERTVILKRLHRFYNSKWPELSQVENYKFY